MSVFETISKPVENATLRVISLGAGVQSSVMALMAEVGEIGPKPDAAIFADTGWEPEGVYKHLDWLESQLSFPVYRVANGNIKTDTEQGINSTGQRFASMPFFVKGGAGMGRRQCTREYKIDPIYKKIRELSGLKPKKRADHLRVEQWIGISTDEIQRIKDAQQKWINNRWPLLEMNMNRQDCQAWFAERYQGRELAKSSCIGCPYHSAEEWRALTAKEFEEACKFDDAIRNYSKMENQQFLHRSCVPLREVDFSTAEENGQQNWLDECDGMCGV